MISIMMLVQTATPVVTITPPMAPFDLATARPRAPSCSDIDFARAETEVLVCAARPKTPENLLARSGDFEAGPFRPSTEILGGVADVVAEQRSTLMGSAPAAMARFKLKF